MSSNQDDGQVLTLKQAQFATLAQGWPALYLALCAVLAAVAVVHMPLTPWWAWAMFPVFLVPKAVLWLTMWGGHQDLAPVSWLTIWRGREKAVPSSEFCERAVRILGIEVIYCVGAIVIWEVWLTRWGNAESMLLLALCMGGQMVYILFGLQHLRIPSLVAAATCLVGILLIAYSSSKQDGIGLFFVSVVVLQVGGLGGLAYVAFNTSRTFANLVNSRLALARKNEKIQALGEETLRIANTDMLTEIGNRRSCFHELGKALAGSDETGHPVSFGVIDLDGFKGVNDTNGHLVGDRLLTAMAERLKRNLEGHGEVFRLGGDEFAFIVLKKDRPEDLLAIGDAIIASVRQPIDIGGLKLTLGCSVGFASYPRTAANATELYDRADYVLYQAKRTGRGRTIVFDEDHRSEVEASSRIEAALRSADLDAEFFLEFQPVVDPADGRTILMEALPRWRSPALGLVSPDRFLPVADQSGLITSLTPILLRKALAAAKDWPGGLRVAVDVSRYEILTPDRTLNLLSVLGQSGVSPNRVALVIPEAALAKQADIAAVGLRHLFATGAILILNNVAVGRTNFSQLPGLGIGIIKVVSDDTEATATRLAAALARELSLDCVGCGIDTREQFDAARRADGILMQGAFLGAPMGESEVVDFLMAGDVTYRPAGPIAVGSGIAQA